MEAFLDSLLRLNLWIWRPLFVVLIGTGLFLTYRLKGLQFRYLLYSLKLAFTRHDDDSEGDISHFQALMTALAATIGIGNIAGVATAIAMGGLGSILWLWVTALIGMATKYSEAVLAIRYRIVDDRGEMAGGPMYYIERGLGWKRMAAAFAFFATIATLCTGNLVQSNSIASAVTASFGVEAWITGAVLAFFTGLVLLGGIRSIGGVTSFLVPFMAVAYILGSLLVLAFRYEYIPEAIATIIRSAFTGQAAVGGFAGSTIMLAVQMGVARGIFSNESGLGSASIAAAAAKTDYPSRQALISMTGSFLSTVVCTFTGLAIAVTHVLGQTGPDGKVLNGAPMTIFAFAAAFPYGGYIVVFGSILFGYSTIVGWAYYGEKSVEYLAGTRAIPLYRILFTLVVFVGVLIPIDIVWILADMSNAFMAFPNLIGLLALSSIVVRETDVFFQKTASERLS
ncbi:MAG: Amino-acid carrier protein AlsT [Chlamydiae bacterium]|nr:Amino-acid carrier protein AlsT [Chlamydiota bacterium]